MEAAFAVGQYVELHPTIPSSFSGSIDGGPREIFRHVDLTRPDDDSYLVAFLQSEKLTGANPGAAIVVSVANIATTLPLKRR